MNISELKGKVLKRISKKDDYEILFECEGGDRYLMFHEQDCSESVVIDDINGDLDNLIGSEILIAEETTSKRKNPKGLDIPDDQESFTWTFYRLATINGYINIRWYGDSNGYYSESVDFIMLNKNDKW